MFLGDILALVAGHMDFLPVEQHFLDKLHPFDGILQDSELLEVESFEQVEEVAAVLGRDFVAGHPWHGTSESQTFLPVEFGYGIISQLALRQGGDVYKCVRRGWMGGSRSDGRIRSAT